MILSRHSFLKDSISFEVIWGCVSNLAISFSHVSLWLRDICSCQSGSVRPGFHHLFNHRAIVGTKMRVFKLFNGFIRHLNVVFENTIFVYPDLFELCWLVFEVEDWAKGVVSQNSVQLFWYVALKGQLWPESPEHGTRIVKRVAVHAIEISGKLIQLVVQTRLF